MDLKSIMYKGYIALCACNMFLIIRADCDSLPVNGTREIIKLFKHILQ